MKKILSTLTLTLIAVLVIIVLALNPIAKFVVEREASKAWGAPIRISDLNISLTDRQVTLQSLSVADLDDNLKKLISAERIFVDIELQPLLDNKIEINTLQVEGLSLLKGFSQQDVLGEESSTESGLPSFSLPDTDELIATQKQALDTDIAVIKSEISAIEDSWKNKLDTLPNEENLDNYKQRLNALKGKGDVFQKLAAAKDIKNVYEEIRTDLRTIESLQADFKRDQKALQNQITTARKLPNKYSQQLVQSLGLDPDQLNDIASRALAGDLKAALQDMLESFGGTENDSTSEPLPYDIILHQAKISGPLFEQIPGLAITANINDVTYPLEKAAKPATISLKGGTDQMDTIQLSSSIDHRSAIKDSLQLKTSGLKLSDITLSENSELSIKLLNALLDLQASIGINGDQLSGQIRQNFSQNQFDIALADDASDSALIIADLIKAATEFGLSIKIGGTLSSPQLSFASSSLDKLASKAINSQIKIQLEALQTKLTADLAEQLSPELQALITQSGGLSSIGEQLGQQQNAWKKLSK